MSGAPVSTAYQLCPQPQWPMRTALRRSEGTHGQGRLLTPISEDGAPRSNVTLAPELIKTRPAGYLTVLPVTPGGKWLALFFNSC